MINVQHGNNNDATEAIKINLEQNGLNKENLLRLPLRAFWAGAVDGRPTEWLACFLMRNGWIPDLAYCDPAYFSPPRNRNRVPLGFQVTVYPSFDGAVGRVCSNCCTQFPLTGSYWHRDPKGRGGWQSLCKSCRNEGRRAYYSRVKKC